MKTNQSKIFKISFAKLREISSYPDYISFLIRLIAGLSVFISSSSYARCAIEYANLSAVLLENTGGNPLVDQLRKARLAQAQSALSACQAEERREKAELSRIAQEERRRMESLRIEQENAAMERDRINQLAAERATATQEAEAARMAEQNLRGRVSTAILEGRCEDAKTIALLASRIDMAEQALRICKPQASKPPLVAGSAAATQGRTLPATPKATAANAVQPKPASGSTTRYGAPQPTSVGTPPAQSPTASTFSLRKALAEQGNADAQYNLGVMYYNGHGVAQDYAAALTWFRKAAEQGVVDAQFNLGRIYRNALGVTQDYAAAAYWYRKAAEQGDGDAQTNLAVMYKLGQGVPQDDAVAVGWLRKAADRGHAIGQYNLGVMYRDGRGVTQNSIEAYKWFSLAADTGYANATNQRYSLAINMSVADIEEAQRQAKAWRR